MGCSNIDENVLKNLERLEASIGAFFQLLPMPTYVALLRGINVGKAKRIHMVDLRALMVELGFSQVATLLNSGNVVFHAPPGTSATYAARISHVIAEKLHLDVPVVVKSASEWVSIVTENSLAQQVPDHSRMLVVFAQDDLTLAGLESIGRLTVAPESFVVGHHAAFLHCANGILDSKAGAALLGKAGKAVTTRNWATVLKLTAMVEGSGA